MDKEDPFAKERVQMLLKKDMMKGDPGYTPVKGKDYFTTAEKREFVEAIQKQITAKFPKDGKDGVVDYNLVLKYIESTVDKFVKKIRVPKDGKDGRDGRDGVNGRDGINGKDAVIKKEMMEVLIRGVIETLPQKDFLVRRKDVEDLVNTHINTIKNTPRQFLGSVASIKNLLDVNLDSLSQDAQGNYILGSGAGSSLPDQTGQAGKFLTTDGSDASWGTPAGSGDMTAAVYDPQAIAGDAFDTDNHTDGTTNKVYTATEKTKLAGIAAGAEVNPDVISQADAEAGTATDERIFTAERVSQAIAALAPNTTIPFSTGAGAPASAPTAAPSVYYDTTNKVYYFATGTSTTSDWAISLGTGSVTKGDMLVANASGVFVPLTVGSNDQVLVADSTESLGVKWAAQSGGGNGTAVTSGAGAPVSTPAAIGDRYYDTTNLRVYHAFGTTDANDWRYTETSA